MVNWNAIAAVLTGLSTLATAIATIFIARTFLVYRGQWEVMKKQIEVMRETSSAQTTLALSVFLHSPELYEARRHLLETLAKKDFQTWTADDRNKARRAIGAYDIAGILSDMGAMPRKVLIENWGDSILRCHAAGEELVNELRQAKGHLWWDNFQRLVADANQLFGSPATRSKNAPG